VEEDIMQNIINGGGGQPDNFPSIGGGGQPDTFQITGGGGQPDFF